MARSQAWVSNGHRVTIPAAPFREAGFKPGDTVWVEAEEVGRIALTPVGELADRYSGCIDTGGTLRNRIDELRKEWS